MSSVEAPKEWKGTHASVLDALTFLREYEARMQSVMVFVGSGDVHRFASFVNGIGFHLFLSGAPNPGYGEFLTWLRLRHALSSGPWEDKFLADAGGDHAAAIHRFLDEVAAFRALRSVGK